MKKFIFSVAICLAAGVFAFAQSKFPELEKIKQIKLLESTRDDVKRIFREYDEDAEDEKDSSESEDDETTSDEYETDNMSITFRYSLGNCSDDDDDEWNVGKGKVTEIEITLDENVKPKYLKIDLGKLERINKQERGDEEKTDADDYIYYDKEKGVSYELSDGEIENIKYTPTEINFPALCGNETVREFISSKEWLIDKLKRRPLNTIVGCGFANVDEMLLSRNEITTSCAVGANESAACGESAEISVETKGNSSDPNDILIYNYTVSGGKIIGTGANVTWDLNGVKPGRYTITAGVDAGGGARGTTKTEEVVVKEFTECQPK